MCVGDERETIGSPTKDKMGPPTHSYLTQSDLDISTRFRLYREREKCV